jgi:predicted CoA-binding protein
MNEPETIKSMLTHAKTIAVVGLSENPERASYGVSHYMQKHGYRIVPVNPAAEGPILGEKVYANLDDAVAGVGQIDIVDVFRHSSFVPEIVKDVMRLKIPNLWLQEGVCHDEATGWAENDGIKVVSDRCIMRDHAALHLAVS